MDEESIAQFSKLSKHSLAIFGYFIIILPKYANKENVVLEKIKKYKKIWILQEINFFFLPSKPTSMA